MLVIWTTARNTNTPIGTTTEPMAANRVSVADNPVPNRLLSRLKRGVNR
jgi:hypothetical protein